MNWRVFGKLNAETIARLEKTHDNDYWAHVPNKRGKVRAIIGHMCPIIVLLVFAAPRARLSSKFIFFDMEIMSIYYFLGFPKQKPKNMEISKTKKKKTKIKHLGRIRNTLDRPATLWDGSDP